MKKPIWKRLLLAVPVAVIALALGGCASTPKKEEAKPADHPAKTDEAATKPAEEKAEHPEGEHPKEEHPEGEHPKEESPE